MRSLVIAGDFPWPASSGSRIRLLITLRGLARCGPVDLFSIVPAERAEMGSPDMGEPQGCVERYRVVPIRQPGPVQSVLGSVIGAFAPRIFPPRFDRRQRREVIRHLVSFAEGSYDLLWCFGAAAWEMSGEPGPLEVAAQSGTRVAIPTIVDLDDLENVKIRARLALGTKSFAIHGHVVSLLEARRWSRLYARAHERTSVLVVCSDLDARRGEAMGLTGTKVVSNAYPRPTRQVGRVEVGSPPTVLFHGTLRYPPNADAARFLAHEVGPELRRLVPQALIRMVGMHNPDLKVLHDPPRVTIRGPVSDMAAELASADLVVVPVRYGSGTRLKVLEAFAHRVPVVSTTLGAEGLGALDGIHLLIADNPPALARACMQLLTDVSLRQKLTAAASELYLRHFDSELVESTVANLARDVVATHQSTRSPVL